MVSKTAVASIAVACLMCCCTVGAIEMINENENETIEYSDGPNDSEEIGYTTTPDENQTIPVTLTNTTNDENQSNNFKTILTDPETGDVIAIIDNNPSKNVEIGWDVD